MLAPTAPSTAPIVMGCEAWDAVYVTMPEWL
jgi:hypothetical protein